MRIIDFADGFTSATEPTQGNTTSNSFKVFASDAAFVTDKGSAATLGDAYTNSSTNKLRFYNGSGWANTVIESTAGNVTITGSFTDLAVIDKDVTLNKGGDDTSSEGAGLQIERSTTNGSIKFEAALASKWKIGLAGSEVEVANVSSSQTFTNKNIDGNNNTLANIADASLKTVLADAHKVLVRDVTGAVESEKIVNNNVDDAAAIAGTKIDPTFGAQTVSTTAAFQASEVSTPATPSAGTQKLYPKSDGKWYTLDDAGIETQVGSGSGGGGINYILNPNAETDASGWSTYDDAAATPVDGTGGTVTTTWTRSTSSPLRGAASFLLSKDASNRSGEGAAYDFTIDAADKSKVMQISFDVDASNANYVDDDIYVWIYDVTNATLIYPAFQKIKKAAYTFQTTFVASTSTSYRLIFHYAGTNATAVDVKFDNISVGPVVANLGVPVETRDITSLVTVTGFGTLAAKEVKMQRVGSYARMFGWFTAGTLQATSGSINFPTGITLDTSGLTAAKHRFGFWNRVNSGASSNWWSSGDAGALFYNSLTTGVTFSSTVTSNAYVNNAISTMGTVSNGDTVSFDFTFPVAEWAGSSVYLSQSKPEYAYNSETTSANDTTSFAYGPAGATVPNRTVGTATTKRVRFLTPIQPTDRVVIQFQEGSGATTWFEASQYFPYTNQGAKDYGLVAVYVNSTDIDVTFGNGGFRSSSGTYASNGQAWSDLYTAGYKWRVVKVPGTVQVASPTTVKYMTKIAASNVTSNVAILSFSNLTIGKTYSVSGKISFNVNNTDKYAQANLTNGATTIDVFLEDHSGATISASGMNLAVSTGPFIATATTMTLTGVSLSADAYVYGDGTRAGTYLTLQEHSTHTPTTEWN